MNWSDSFTHLSNTDADRLFFYRNFSLFYIFCQVVGEYEHLFKIL